MAQETPSNTLYAQAANAIRKLTVAYSTNKNKTPDDISQNINDTLTKFAYNAGKTVTKFKPIKKSQVPISSQQNEFMSSLQFDINLLQDQGDLLIAAAIATHNYIKMSIMQAAKDNLRIRNKIKSLELYSSANDNSLIYFGDTFITEDFIDWNLVNDSEKATLLSNGFITLHLQNQQTAITSGTSIAVLNGSNGFFGNNQEVKDPASETVDPTSGQSIHQFVGATYPASSIINILDNKPATWFEFEKYLISPNDRTNARDFNFRYRLNSSSANTAHLLPPTSSIDQGNNSTIDWANGITDALKFYFQIDLGIAKSVNVITLLPYGLTNNTNNPIHVLRVITSIDGTEWTVVGPENVWISNSIDKKLSTINAESISIGSAAWLTDGSPIRYIKMEIEQPSPITVNIGHQYYVTKNASTTNTPQNVINIPTSTTNAIYNVNLPYNANIPYGGPTIPGVTADSGYGDYAVASTISIASTDSTAPAADAIYRVEGPLAPAEKPLFYNTPANLHVNDLTQKVEVFSGKRWAIGIRDIGVNSNVYGTTGIIISKRFDIPGIVDRVALEAEVVIPDGYDLEVDWIKFYISADDGSTWLQISRIQDDFLGIPEIIAFNDPTPTELREPGVGYHDAKGTVNSLRFKAVITRPTEAQNSTPILKSYKLKIVKRS